MYDTPNKHETNEYFILNSPTFLSFFVSRGFKLEMRGIRVGKLPIRFILIHFKHLGFRYTGTEYLNIRLNYYKFNGFLLRYKKVKEVHNRNLNH